LGKALSNVSKITKTEDGRVVEILNPNEVERCRVQAKDGAFEMPAYVLKISG